MIIPAGETAQIVKDGKLVEKLYQPIDTDTIDYCWKHSITLTSDWRNPSQQDQKKLNRIKLRVYDINDKGVLKKARYCPRCLQTVYYTRQP